MIQALHPARAGAAMLRDVLRRADELRFQLLVRQASLHLADPGIEADVVGFSSQVLLVGVRDELEIVLDGMSDPAGHRPKVLGGQGGQRVRDLVGAGSACQHILRGALDPVEVVAFALAGFVVVLARTQETGN